MSHEAEHRSVTPPKFWKGKPEEHSRKLADSLRGVLLGHTNNHYTVTLEVGTDCTEIPYPSARPGVSVLITPQNESAAGFSRANNVWGEAEVGKVKVCHDATAAGTEIYGVVIVG